MPAQDRDNMKANIWHIYIDGADAPFHATVSVGEMLAPGAVTTQRYGSTPIGHIVDGHKCDLGFDFQEVTVDTLKMALGISEPTANVNKLPTIGTLLPTHNIRLHNPSDGADTSADIVFPSVAFGSFTNSTTGQGIIVVSVKAMAELDFVSGDLSQIGYVAP